MVSAAAKSCSWSGRPRFVTEVQLDWCYQREWPDGFGARGWKLATAINDPNIIASTPATGDRIPTAVLAFVIFFTAS